MRADERHTNRAEPRFSRGGEGGPCNADPQGPTGEWWVEGSGVAWRDRPDGLRELVGVDDELIERFSTRRRAITAKRAELIDAYRDKYGMEPLPAVISAMAQAATLKTRAREQEVSGEEALERWKATARQRGRELALLPRQVLRRAGHTQLDGDDGTAHGEVAALLERLAASGRATLALRPSACGARCHPARLLDR